MRQPRKSRKTAALVALCATLAACDAPPSVEPPAPTETALPEPSATPVSILRETPAKKVEDIAMEPLEVTIPFANGGPATDERAQAALSQIIESPQFKAGGRIVLRGHSDSVGNDEANLRASQRRAEEIAKSLEEAGVNIENMEIIAIGEQRPIAPNAHLDGTPDEDGRARNRRVDVTVNPPPARSGSQEEPAPAQDDGEKSAKGAVQDG